MSRKTRPVEDHYFKNAFRFNTAHLGPNREQRRAQARRDPRTGKLVVEHSRNFTYRNHDNA